MMTINVTCPRCGSSSEYHPRKDDARRKLCPTCGYKFNSTKPGTAHVSEPLPDWGEIKREIIELKAIANDCLRAGELDDRMKQLDRVESKIDAMEPMLSRLIEMMKEFNSRLDEGIRNK